MYRQPLTKIVLIHACQDRFPGLWDLLSKSVARVRKIDGCLYCRLNVSSRNPQYWIIHGVWNCEDSLQVGLAQELKGTLEYKPHNNSLLSIMIYGEDGLLPSVDMLKEVEHVPYVYHSISTS